MTRDEIADRFLKDVRKAHMRALRAFAQVGLAEQNALAFLIFVSEANTGALKNTLKLSGGQETEGHA